MALACLLSAARCVGYLDADAGVSSNDGGAHTEGGTRPDGGLRDATGADGGLRDATGADGGLRDATGADGSRHDAPSGVDGGAHDAGHDASSDARTADGGPPDATSSSTLEVSGNRLLDHGQPVRLFGVFRAGTQYSCTEDAGIFDGPATQASIEAILSWKVNAVRVPFNETCWLGINGVPPAFSGANYQSALLAYVRLLRQNGLYVIAGLHWAAPGTTIATGRIPMPDAEHALTFWQEVADKLKDDRGILFDLYSEPSVSDGADANADGPANTNGTDAWTCWEQGCTVASSSGNYASAGMTQLLGAVRGTGATNVVIAAGIDQATDVSHWLAHKPADATGNLVAGFATASNAPSCTTSACWRSSVAPVAAAVPVITTSVDEIDCNTVFIKQYLPWADEAGVSYVAETWNTDYACTVTGGAASGLIDSYDGSPNAYGAGYKAHLAIVNP